jgi:hypothetical protein
LGQPLIEISEPCGKRSFIGSRMLAISVAAAVFVRAVSHALDTPDATPRISGNNAPLPSEAARTILTAKGQVKIAPKLATALNWLLLFRKIETGCAQLPRCESSSRNRTAAFASLQRQDKRKAAADRQVRRRRGLLAEGVAGRFVFWPDRIPGRAVVRGSLLAL